MEGYHNQPVALTIRLEDVGGTGWTKLEASTEQNAPEKRTDLTEALQKDGAAPYTGTIDRYGVFLYHRTIVDTGDKEIHRIPTNGTVTCFITDPGRTEHKETYTDGFL